MDLTKLMRYQESIGAPVWLMWLLLAGLVAAVVGSVAPAFDSAGWSLYAWYLPLMLFTTALLMMVFIAFRRLRIEVGDTAVRISFGVLRKSLPLEAIQGCEVKSYRWLTYGGWGIRFARGGRRAWSMPGISEGVELTVAEGTRVRRYFVSSRSPELLAAAIAGR